MARPHVSKSWCVGQTTTVCKRLFVHFARTPRMNTKIGSLPMSGFELLLRVLILVSCLLNVGE